MRCPGSDARHEREAQRKGDEMRLICPNCAAQYEIDAAVLPEKGRDVECSRCGQIWFQPRNLPSQPAEFDAAARPTLNRSLSDSVLAVLREEAARELRARDEDNARARAEKARFEAESFAPTPRPNSPLPEFPFVDEVSAPTEEPRGPAPETEAPQIDWPATTITDERILEAPIPPRNDVTEDEWIVATPPLDGPAPDNGQVGDVRYLATSGDFGPSADAVPDDEPVATILFDEPGARETDTRSDTALSAPRTLSPASAARQAVSATRDLPSDLPGDTPDDSPATPDHPGADAFAETPLAAQTPSLPISVETGQDPTRTPARNGYGRGFGLAIGMAAALAGFYLIAPHLVGSGAIGEFAADYRATADQGRVWLGERVEALTSRRD